MTLKRCALAAAATIVPLLAGCMRDDPDQLLRSGRQYLAQADTNAATIQLKNAVREQPENGEARLLLGRTLLQVGDPVGAEKELRRAQALGQSADEVVPLLAQALLQIGENDRVISEFGQTRLNDPASQADLKASLGDAYGQLRRGEEAAASYRAVLQLQPNDYRAQLGLAQLEARAGRLDVALAATDKVIAANPKVASAYALKSEILRAQGDRPAARAELRKALEADPKFLPARFALIASLIDERDLDAARTELAAAGKAAPGDIRAVYFDGVLAQRAGNLDRARENVAAILKVAPDHLPTLILAASIDLQSNQPASAEAHLRRVLASAPEHREARRLLTGSYLRAGEPAKARETLEPLLKSNAVLDPQLLLLAGETYLANGDVKQASAYYEQASQVEQQKSRAMAHTRLGQIALATGRPEDGLSELEAATKADPESRQAEFALLSAHMRAGEVDKALALARKIEQKNPKDAVSHQVLGMVLLAKKDVTAARRSFERALELSPAYLPAARALAALDVDAGKSDDARRRYNALLQKEPNNARLHLGLAEVQTRSGDPLSEVIQTLQRAVAADSSSVEARLALMSAQRQVGDGRAALITAQQAAASHPNQPQVLQMLAALQEEAGEHNQSIETLRRLSQLQPASTQPFQRIAAVHARRKEYDQAIQSLRMAKEIAPTDVNVSRDLVAVHLMAGRPDDALKEAKAVQLSAPRSAAGWLLESQVHETQRRPAEAERALRAGLKAEPGSAPLAMRLYSVLSGAEKGNDAAAFAKKWIAQFPRDTAFRTLLAERELAAKNYRGAADMYRQIVSIDAKNVVALNNLAWATGRLGDPKALGYAEQAVKLAPNSAPVLDTMGMLLVESGDAARGVDYLARATRIAPNRPDIRLNYAKALAKAGKRPEARRELEALQAQPGDFAGKSEIPEILKSL